MGYLAVEQGKSIYFEHYKGAKRPVLLIHGWGANCRIWDTTLPALWANGNTVVSFDHRACGRSDKDFDQVSINSIASDIVALINHLDLEGVVVNGWSLGAAAAVAATELTADRIAAVVSTAGATPRYVKADDFPYGGTPDDVTQTIAALQLDRANFFHGLVQAVCAVDVGQPVRDQLWQSFMQTGPKTDQAMLDLAHVEQRAILQSMPQPFLSMIGAKDVIVPPEIGKHAAELAPNGKAVYFNESGHAPFLEEGPKYRQELLTFINQLG